MSNLTRVRRANIRKSITAHREGNPTGAPLGSRGFASWVAGEHRAAKVGKRSHHDLDRGHPRVAATQERQYRIPAASPASPLPARQAKRKRQPGQGSGLAPLMETGGVQSPYYRPVPASKRAA